MITKVINVNLHQPIYERLTAKQGDIASRYLLFHLLDGDKPFDLTGRSVRVYAIKPDKTEIFNDLTINDASKGYCTLELTSQCLASAGVVKMELYISQSGKVLTSIPFELEVIACINTANSVTSTNEFSALEVALSSLQGFTDLKNEVIAARGSNASLVERLDKVDDELHVDLPFWEVPAQPDTWATTPSGKDLDIDSEEYMDLFFNPYVGKTYSDGYKVSKKVLGKDESNTYNIYEYIFEPKYYTRTIIITAGNHPYELPAHFGFGRLIYYIMNEPDLHEGLRYIRDNVRIVSIPVINPWGFSQSPKIYGNCNLVNINRNFDSNGRWDKFPTNEGDEWNYKGAAPFSEAETRILRDFYIKYADVSEFAIDCHCGVDMGEIDQYFYSLTRDNYFTTKMKEAAALLDKRLRVTLGREPKNRFVIDADSSLRMWYSSEQLGLANGSVEYVPQRYGGSMNGATDLKYYLLHLSNYLFRLLSRGAFNKMHETDTKLSKTLTSLKQTTKINDEILKLLVDVVLGGSDDYTEVSGTTINVDTKRGVLLDLSIIGRVGDINSNKPLKFACEENKVLLNVDNASYEIPLVRALRAVNNDVYDEITNGKYIKRIIRDINFNIEYVSELTNTYYFRIAGVYGKENANEHIACNIFPTNNAVLNTDVEGIRMGSSDGGVQFRILKSKLDNDKDKIIDYLVDNDFEFVYEAKQPQEFEIEMPLINTISGSTTITTNNETKPLIKCKVNKKG